MVECVEVVKHRNTYKLLSIVSYVRNKLRKKIAGLEEITPRLISVRK